MVFDRQTVLYNLVDDVSGKHLVTSLITKHPDLANSFVKLFEFYWENAKPLDVFLKEEGLLNDATEDKQ